MFSTTSEVTSTVALERGGERKGYQNVDLDNAKVKSAETECVGKRCQHGLEKERAQWLVGRTR